MQERIFLAVRQAPDMLLDLAEAAREGELRFLRKILVAKRQDVVFQERVHDRVEDLVVERCRQVDAPDLGAAHGDSGESVKGGGEAISRAGAAMASGSIFSWFAGKPSVLSYMICRIFYGSFLVVQRRRGGRDEALRGDLGEGGAGRARGVTRKARINRRK